ncbi:MAG: hypothetical protein WCO28_09900 [Bacteroidota bacterium]
MKLLKLYALSKLFSTACPSLMPTKKICRDCIHFIGDNIECGKFSDTNIITGKITYESAKSVRKDEQKCGENAILFEKNHFKIITIPYYFFKEQPIILTLCGVLSLYFLVITHILHN